MNASALFLAKSTIDKTVPAGVVTLCHKQAIRIEGSLPHHDIRVGTSLGYCGKTNESEIAWTNRAAACIHNGSQEMKDAERESEAEVFAVAQYLETGMRVWIDGYLMRVIVNGIQYSDPVAFRKEA